MLSKPMTTAINNHMNTELYSALLYLSMSSYAGYIGFKGAANWFQVQYQEEMFHFTRFYNYLNSQGEHAQLGPVKAAPAKWKSLLVMYEDTLKHEQFITKCINELADLAGKEKDHATGIFLQWFITEQIEEEENDRDIIGKLKIIGDNGNGLLLLDNELATRIYTPPVVPA